MRKTLFKGPDAAEVQATMQRIAALAAIENKAKEFVTSFLALEKMGEEFYQDHNPLNLLHFLNNEEFFSRNLKPDYNLIEKYNAAKESAVEVAIPLFQKEGEKSRLEEIFRKVAADFASKKTTEEQRGRMASSAKMPRLPDGAISEAASDDAKLTAGLKLEQSKKELIKTLRETLRETLKRTTLPTLEKSTFKGYHGNSRGDATNYYFGVAITNGAKVAVKIILTEDSGSIELKKANLSLLRSSLSDAEKDEALGILLKDIKQVLKKKEEPSPAVEASGLKRLSPAREVGGRGGFGLAGLTLYRPQGSFDGDRDGDGDSKV